MSNIKTTALANRIKGIKKSFANKASGVLSSPARAYYGLKTMRAKSEANVLRQARSYDGAPDFNDKGMPTDAFKVRTVADSVRAKHTIRK